MPLYEYQCEACGRTMEVIQKFSDAPLTECKTCGGSLEQLLSVPAIQFKGSGWYVTDYARKNGNSGDGESKSEKSESKDRKAESKPESKADSHDSAKAQTASQKD